MDKNQIGTDATMADHMETIQKRNYALLNNDKRFIPSSLGIGLVETYEKLEIPLADYKLRKWLKFLRKCLIF